MTERLSLHPLTIKNAGGYSGPLKKQADILKRVWSYSTIWFQWSWLTVIHQILPVFSSWRKQWKCHNWLVKKIEVRDFADCPVVKTAFPMQGPWVWFLVGELRSRLPGVQAKTKREVSSLPHPIPLEELYWNFHNSKERDHRWKFPYWVEKGLSPV